MGLTFTTAQVGRGSVKASWYFRIVLYLAVLIVTALLVNGLRGRIPMAFGLTPIQVKALSVVRLPYESSGAAGGSLADVSVNVRIVGNDSLPDGVTLTQFHLTTKNDARYSPYASTFLFGPDGRLRITPGDTLYGALLFSVPADETPEELWWRP